jgi:hypothetical protein
MSAIRSTGHDASRSTRTPAPRAHGLARGLAPIALAAFAVAPALAQEKGDQYEVTVKMEIKGMPMAMPARTTQLCVAKNARDEAFVPRKEGECSVTNSKKVGNTVTYRIQCTGKESLVGDGEITYAADGYTGKMHMTGTGGGQPFDMTQTYTGKKIGECVNPVR